MEKASGNDTQIGFIGVTLGDPGRKLIFKSISEPHKRFVLELKPGEAYWVSYKTNLNYKHMINKVKDAGLRISLTYRRVLNWKEVSGLNEGIFPV